MKKEPTATSRVSRTYAEDPGGFYALAQTQLQETNRQAVQLESLSKDVKGLIEQISGLATVVKGTGDGEKGLTWRLSMLEQSSTAMREDIHQLRLSSDVRASEDQKGRWTLAQAVTVAVIALIATVVTAVINALITGRKPF